MLRTIAVFAAQEVYRKISAGPTREAQPALASRGGRRPPEMIGQPYLVAGGTLANPVMSAAELQEELVLSLSGGDKIDPYDFSNYWEQWAEQHDLEGSDFHDEIEKPKVRRAFTKWLTEKNVLGHWMLHDQYSVPARYWFSRVRPVPAGTWLVHHTHTANVTRFDRGEHVDQLANTRGIFGGTPAKASGKNLDDSVGAYERIYAFAFQPEDDPCIGRDGGYRCGPGSSAYGPHLVVFQCDAAVEAYHQGNEATETMFPVGSEYNVTSVTADRGRWFVELADTSLLAFDTFDELTGWIEATAGAAAIARTG